MSYPDVVKSSRNLSPQRPVNVTQRSQVSSAALIESEAGIKKGHVISIASRFGPQQNPSVSRRPSAMRQSSETGTADPVLAARSKPTRIAVVPKEASVRPAQAQPAAQVRPVSAADSSTKTSASALPAPWPKSTAVGQLKSVKSFGKSDSDLYASSTEVRGASEASRPNAIAQPTIVFNKAKYVPRTTRPEEKPDLTTRRQSSELPSSVKVGRWTVYETLPFGSKLNKTGAAARAADRNSEEEEWKRREALERDRMAEAERRKNEYDRKHREELEAQERRRREELAAEEQRRRRELETEEEERRRRVEEERMRRREMEEQERRRLEEEQREAARLENERRLREAREKRRLEMEQEEEVRRQRQERRRREEQAEMERRREEAEKRRAEQLQREEEELRRSEEKRTRDSNADLYTAEEWTVYESAPVSQAAVQWQGRQSFNYPSGKSSLANSNGRQPRSEENYGDFDSNIESEYVRNLREIEEKRREQEQKDANQRRREALAEDERRRPTDAASRKSDSQRFQEGVNQWAALTENEPQSSGSAIGYRRFLEDSDKSGSQPKQSQTQEDARRQDEAIQERRRREADEDRRRHQESLERRRNEDNRRRQETEAQRRQRDADEARRREEEQKRREADERRFRQAQEDQRRREREQVRRDSDKRRRLEDERRLRQDGRSGFNKQNHFDRWNRDFGSNQGMADFVKQDEWSVSESAPGPSEEDSVVGYRRLLAENDGVPPQRGNADRSRSNSRRSTRTKIRIVDDPKNGRQRYIETENLSSHPRQGPESAETESVGDDTPHFEEWTEYHSVPPQLQGVNLAESPRSYDWPHRQPSESSDHSEEAPKFEEWTVVHRLPASSQSKPGGGYDVVDDNAVSFHDSALPDRPKGRDKDWQVGSGSRQQLSSERRRFKSTDSLSRMSSSEEATVAVEEIMPRRLDSGRRQRDLIVAAALRQLEAAPSSGFSSSADKYPADGAAGAAGTPTSRLSPYHSYQRIHHDHRGRYSRDDYAAAAAASGNVFQDSFSVTRDNPAHYWQEA